MRDEIVRFHVIFCRAVTTTNPEETEEGKLKDIPVN
jgi:hypothetical protein